MSVHAPHNPLESDDAFYNVLQHSHYASVQPVAGQQSYAKLDNLTKAWKQGKLSYRDYAVQKYAAERAMRSMGRTYKGKP